MVRNFKLKVHTSQTLFEKNLKGKRKKSHHDCPVLKIAPSMESASQPVCKRHGMRTNSNGTVEKCVKISHVEDIYSYAAKSSVGRNEAEKLRSTK